MSDSNDFQSSAGAGGSAPLTVVPVRSGPPRSPLRGLFRLLFTLLFFFSIGLNFILFALMPGCSSESSLQVEERYHSGQKLAKDKVAVVRIDGVLMEGMLGFARKQIERAASDKHVKAVVLRVNSPGGSITASDDLHKRIVDLRKGDSQKNADPKPIVVSMGGMAASGGYYISMPAQTVMAERTTITGSIGVYAAFPNVTELSHKVGFQMNVIKAGKVKDSGSPFHDMTPEERQVWEYMVDHAYLQFLDIVEQGRPQLKGKLQEDVVIDTTMPVRNDKGMAKELHFTRYRADGGIYTAEEAKRLGLIDQIGYLDDAIQAAKQAAGLGEQYKAVVYDRPLTFWGLLSGDSSSDTRAYPSNLANSVVPRLWYLSPQCELAGLLQAAQN